MPLTSDVLDDVFSQLVDAAIAGQRCPVTAREGVPGLPGHATSVLAREGRIKVEIYAHNWRVVEILDGPHAGARTKPCPHETNGPYRIIGREAARNTTVKREVEVRSVKAVPPPSRFYTSNFEPT